AGRSGSAAAGGAYCAQESGSVFVFFFSSRRRHTRFSRDWSSDVCSSDLIGLLARDDLLLLAKTAAVVVIPDELDDAVVRFRAGRSEERRVGKECRCGGAPEQ